MEEVFCVDNKNAISIEIQDLSITKALRSVCAVETVKFWVFNSFKKKLKVNPRLSFLFIK